MGTRITKYDNSAKLAELTGTALDELVNLIRVKEPDEIDRFRMTRLTSLVSSYSRIVEAQAANRKTDLTIARALAGEDDELFERYVRRAFPSIDRMLGDGR